jgi:hypothetical protein
MSQISIFIISRNHRSSIVTSHYVCCLFCRALPVIPIRTQSILEREMFNISHNISSPNIFKINLMALWQSPHIWRFLKTLIRNRLLDPQVSSDQPFLGSFLNFKTCFWLSTLLHPHNHKEFRKYIPCTSFSLLVKSHSFTSLHLFQGQAVQNLYSAPIPT